MQVLLVRRCDASSKFYFKILKYKARFLVQRIIALLLLSVFSSLAVADSRYKLVPFEYNPNRGSVQPVCRVLAANLNKFCDQPPMACGLRIHEAFRKQLLLPDWQPLDPESNRALIEEFLKARWESTIRPEDSAKVREDDHDKLDAAYAEKLAKGSAKIWEEQRSALDVAYAEQQISFSKTELDVHNLGIRQAAYRLELGNCNAANPQFDDSSISWLGWNEPISGAKVQINYAPTVIRRISQKYLPLGISELGEVFIFGGKTYTFWMAGTERHPNELIVSIPGPSILLGTSITNVCRFQYQAKKGTKGESK